MSMCNSLCLPVDHIQPFSTFTEWWVTLSTSTVCCVFHATLAGCLVVQFNIHERVWNWSSKLKSSKRSRLDLDVQLLRSIFACRFIVRRHPEFSRLTFCHLTYERQKEKSVSLSSVN